MTPEEASAYWAREAVQGAFEQPNRLPLLTVVIPSAVVGISEMWGLIKRRQGKKTIMFSDASFAAAAKYSLLGDVMITQEKTETAVEAYQQILRINSGQKTVRIKLPKVLNRIDQRRAAEEYERLRFVSSFYDLL